MLYNPEWKETIPVDFKNPTLEGLAYVLRHRELWPKGFEWNYGSCTNCAMGLAYEVFEGIPAPSSWNMCQTFPMSHEDAREIFVMGKWTAPFYQMGGDGSGNFGSQSITPEHVANQIDKYLGK